MLNNKMTFEQIKNNKEEFLSVYGLKDKFKDCCCTWNELMAIGEDFEVKRNNDYFDLLNKYIVEISKFDNVHSYRYRIKSTDSLLAKIITKSAKKKEHITLDNYFCEISDLLGIRILYVFKEDYWSVHKQIMDCYKKRFAENIHLKLRDGDDEKTYEKLLSSRDVQVEKNMVYRSIHYTIYADPSNIEHSPKIEIQTRTIFEEGWSEINHKLVYKKGMVSNPNLEKTSCILSELVGSCDAIGTLMKYLYDEGITSQPLSETGECDSTDRIGEAIRKLMLK